MVEGRSDHYLKKHSWIHFMATCVKLSHYVMDFIARQNVKNVFLLVGGGAMHLNDSLGRCHGLKYVCNLHEQASPSPLKPTRATTTIWRAAMVTTGPGSTNTVTGVAGGVARLHPVMFLSGQVKRADLKRDTGVRILGVQEIDIVTIVAPSPNTPSPSKIQRASASIWRRRCTGAHRPPRAGLD